MSSAARDILDHLAAVERLRAERSANLALADRVTRLKSYQAQRFARTYTDMLQNPRYQAAARFFLDELYGPQEFGARDAQFARVVPALVRLFPEDIVRTVASLAALHALSESLDKDMALQMGDAAMDRATYVRLWQNTGRATARQEQIELTVGIGRDLDRYTRSRMLRGTLHMMRRPARAAGLSELQRFLEAGFDTFGAMQGADGFLNTVRERELALSAALFHPEAQQYAKADGHSSADDTPALVPLGQLP